MRALLALLAIAVAALAADPVSDEEADAILDEFDKAFKKTKVVEEKQGLVYDLHDVMHDDVIDRLEKIALRDRDPDVRNVAALALGGQKHNVAMAGKALQKVFDKQQKEEVVLASVLEAMAELNYLGYWPKAKKLMSDERSSIVIRTLDLLGANKDYRALPKLLDMYQVALPKRMKWKTGTVTVDTGAAGDADQKAAEAKFNAKYGRGGSKMKAKAKAKAKAFDERNFSTQLRKCVKAITGESFDTALGFEDWYVENYVEVMRKIAQMEGRNIEQAVAKAKSELPALKAKVDEERKKLEEELEQERKAGK